VVLSFVDLGSDLKNVAWAKTIDEFFILVFRLLSYDIFATIALPAFQNRLDSFSNIDRRTSIPSGLISAISFSNIAYTLHTRISVIAWSLDQHFASFTLPQSSLDFISVLTRGVRSNSNIRETIVSSIVSYFKNLFVRNSRPIQSDLLFSILETQFSAPKTAFRSTVCRRLRPKYCGQLARHDKIYLELMAPTSTPIVLFLLHETSVNFQYFNVVNGNHFINDILKLRLVHHWYQEMNIFFKLLFKF
jgi:hypothetical protein